MAGLRSPEPEQYWQNTPQNPVLGAAASGLRAVKDAGGVVGEFFLGDAPEEIERWSYGNSPIRERVPGTSPRYPEFKKDRFMPVVDAAFLPVGETVAAAKLAGAGARGLYNAGMRGYEAATDGAASMGRRDALKKIGQGVGASALGGAGVRELAKLVGPENVAKTAVKAARRYSPPVFRPFFNKFWQYVDDPPEGIPYPEDIEWHRRMYDDGVEYFKQKYADGDDAYEKALIDSFDDPDYFDTVPEMGSERDRLYTEWYRGMIGDDGLEKGELLTAPAQRELGDYAREAVKFRSDAQRHVPSEWDPF